MARVTPTVIRLPGWLTTLIIVSLIVSVILAILGGLYALSLKHDVSTIKKTNQELLRNVADQRKIAEKQMELNQKLLTTSQQQLQVAEQQLEISRSLLGIAQDQDAKLSSSLATQQQLLGVAQATLQQAREINQKMPSLQRAGAALQLVP